MWIPNWLHRSRAGATADDELARFLADLHFILPNLNDTFDYAMADSEQINVGDGEVMADFWRRHGWHGLVAIAAIKRRRDPGIPSVAGDDRYKVALAELRALKPLPPEDGDPDVWTLQDEFELR